MKDVISDNIIDDKNRGGKINTRAAKLTIGHN
jgi:hypothetical protein